MTNAKQIINSREIFKALEDYKNPKRQDVERILKKALLKKGLMLEEAAVLLNCNDKKTGEKMLATAGKIKKEIYGERLVFFAPLYASSYCINDCKYCGFKCGNLVPRKKLSQEEVRKEVEILEGMGHKRLLLEFGEHPEQNPIDYVTDVISTVYSTKKGKGEIRRVNVNIAATSLGNYKKLKEAGIGTYQLFQETYHEPSFKEMHNGPKADIERQLTAHDKAFKAGIDDVGLGVLFGLFDFKFEVLGLLSHARYLDRKFGVGPHTISVPRWQPAQGVSWKKPPAPVSEEELLRIIAILRMSVPYTGMIVSTREKPEVRAKAFEIGISQTSAASKTSPGGYAATTSLKQFNVSDERSVNEVLKSVLKQNLLPSFCTACYRNSRTGKSFMDLAKPGKIQEYCRPNAILTFKEFLEDYADPELKNLGTEVMNKCLNQIQNQSIKKQTIKRLKIIENGKRDIYF